MKNTPNAVTSPGTITAWICPAQPNSLIIMYSGMMPSSVGIACVPMMSSSNTLRPRNFSLANAKPASVENSTTEMVTVPATTIEFTIASAKSVVSKTRAMFAKRCPPGTRTGGTLSIASGVCEDTTNDQYTGKADPASTAISAA
jgi:hypothetical protein